MVGDTIESCSSEELRVMDSKIHLSRSWEVDKSHQGVYTGGDLHFLPAMPLLHADCDGELIACLKNGDVVFMCSKEGTMIQTLQGEVHSCLLCLLIHYVLSVAFNMHMYSGFTPIADSISGTIIMCIIFPTDTEHEQ